MTQENPKVHGWTWIGPAVGTITYHPDPAVNSTYMPSWNFTKTLGATGVFMPAALPSVPAIATDTTNQPKT